jgi:hypothetical protein
MAPSPASPAGPDNSDSMEAELRFGKAQICHSLERTSPPSLRGGNAGESCIMDHRCTLRPVAGHRTQPGRNAAATPWFVPFRIASGRRIAVSSAIAHPRDAVGRPVPPGTQSDALRRAWARRPRARPGRPTAIGGANDPFHRHGDSRSIGGVEVLLTPFVARGCAYIAGCGGFTLRRCRSRATASRSAKSDRFAIAQRPVSRQDSVGTAMLYVQA